MEKAGVFSSVLIGLIGIVVTISFIVKEYRESILLIGGIVILLYIITHQNTQIEQINKIEERFKIYKELINMKADIKHLKNKDE